MNAPVPVPQAEAQVLNRLCELFGIHRHYLDFWQQRHEVPESTLRALLQAAGVPVDDSAAAAAHLCGMESQRWREAMLPVTVVIRHGGPVRLSLALPAAAAQAAQSAWLPPALEWSLEFENGSRAAGELTTATFTLQEVREIEGTPHGRFEFDLPVIPETGYHSFSVLEPGSRTRTLAATRLIVCPERCFEPPAFAQGGRIWGPALQLYALRSNRNWGIGDFADLKSVVELAAGMNAGIVGVNPLHALFPARPDEASPYSPSSRLALNVLYLDVESIAEFTTCEAARERVSSPAFQARLRALRERALVDYSGVGKAKIEILEMLYRDFRERHLGASTAAPSPGAPRPAGALTERGRAYRAFQAEGGESLRLHALFDALHEHFFRKDPSYWGWPAWPESFRDTQSEAVRDFARRNAQRIDYFLYLQWQADCQLGSAQRHAIALGLPIGLYRDLAVGANSGGADTWINRRLHAPAVRIGAPADEFNAKGQDWGLPPFIPHRLVEARYQPFIDILRASMRHAGALRIDHVMSLMRLFWIPAQSSSPGEGTYVAYPFDDLLGILALESRRNRCLIIGEDLGTVPERVRTALKALGALSYRSLYFERADDGEFQPPERYPEQALVTVSTHDLPTLRGFWQGADLTVRHELDMFPSEALRARQTVERAQDRVRLLLALERAGLAEPGTSLRAGAMPDVDDLLVQGVHRFLARTPARLLMVQLEDVFGQAEQVNFPGTVEPQYPNWRRKLPVALESWPDDNRMVALARAMLERPARRAAPAAHGTGSEPRDDPERSAAIPRATYRLQFNRDFTFADAGAAVPYLAALHVSHIYASSYLKARPGSSHGYDITDHNAFNPEIGTEAQFDEMAGVLREHGMGQMLDVVPNHMGVMAPGNVWWSDVLENGPAAMHAAYFDIEWHPLNADLQGKVLLAALGDQYGAALEKGELRLRFDPEQGDFSVEYHQHRFPIDPREYPRILGPGMETLVARSGAEHPLVLEFQSLVTALGHLPGRNETSSGKKAERARDKEVRKRQLARLSRELPQIAQFIDANVAAINGVPGQPASFDALHALLDAQAYRLAHWRVASDEINYRRFFDINDLAALRMEGEPVFEDTHRLVFRLIDEGRIDALRVDHPDGLYDPRRYLEQLQRRAGRRKGAGFAALEEPAPPGIYLAVEKILAEGEYLPQDWPVHGTTGYGFINHVNGLFVDRSQERRFDRIYAGFTGERLDYDEVLRSSKVLIMLTSMSSELNVLCATLSRIASADRRHRDFTVGSLRRALIEIVAAFPVYRTYVTAERISEADRRTIESAVDSAKRRHHAAETSVFDFIRGVLTGGALRGPAGTRERIASFVGRFQQFTSPVMAKGAEDTGFYIYNRLSSLNEVGGNPRTFGLSLEQFHAGSLARARAWPHTMLASSTHDNKRSEDVRARINVISEMPAAWRLALAKWSRLNRRKKTRVAGEPAPSRNDEYLLYQILLGAWPLEPMDQAALAAFRERIQRYMLKAVREAKRLTSWVNPNEEYEAALRDFIGALLSSPEHNGFLDDFLAAQAPVARYGMLNSLSQTLIKLTSPGVPDIYQGNEIWDFSLVDPDNRRPVDYARRRAMLQALQDIPEHDLPPRLREMLDSSADGRIKLYLHFRTLELRARDPELFCYADYRPLYAAGAQADRVCAFARHYQGRSLITIAPRLYVGLTGGQYRHPTGEEVWGETRLVLAPGTPRYLNVLTGEHLHPEQHGKEAGLALASVLGCLPVALLVSESPPAGAPREQAGVQPAPSA